MRIRIGIAVAAVGLLAGCGSTSAPASSLTPGQSVTHAEFAALIKHGREFKTAHVSVTTGPPATRHTMDVDIALHPLAEKLHLVVAGKSVDARLIGHEIYMHMPGAPGNGWAKFNIEAYRSLGMGGLVAVIDNPLAGAEKIARTVLSVTYVGHENRHGVASEHYRATVDVRAAVKTMFSDGLPNAASLPTSATEDLWLDTHRHMTECDVDLGELGVTTIKVTAIDEPLAVKAPPGDVPDITKELEQQGANLLHPTAQS